MATRLLLVRHGRAEPGHNMKDADRRLTDDGVAELRRSLAGLKRLKVIPDRILTSPLFRTQETAELLQREVAPSAAVEPWPELASGAAPETYASVARNAKARGTVAMVGHMPDIGQAVAHLVGGAPLSFEPGGMACIDFDGDVLAGAGRLVWFKSPRDLANS